MEEIPRSVVSTDQTALDIGNDNIEPQGQSRLPSIRRDLLLTPPS